MNDAILRAATTRTGSKSASYQLTDGDWRGPTITPLSDDGSKPPLVDYSTWICPHEPHCLHHTPCRNRYRLEQGR